MQFKTLLFSSLSATAALAAPAIQDRAAKDMMAAAAGQWTITSLSRTCNAALTSCSWTFGINDGTAITPCTVVVGGTPATQTNGGPATCGAYTVTSGWSGQFGEGNGFVSLLSSFLSPFLRDPLLWWPPPTVPLASYTNIIKYIYL